MARPQEIEPYADIRDVSTRIRNRAVSPVAVVDACLARIEALHETSFERSAA
jgi:Asp-tRNA(Asn)/Glu-tRNA(Gln) amidotransferase A subunit family amidase